jgi:hypothetical protein
MSAVALGECRSGARVEDEITGENTERVVVEVVEQINIIHPLELSFYFVITTNQPTNQRQGCPQRGIIMETTDDPSSHVGSLEIVPVTRMTTGSSSSSSSSGRGMDLSSTEPTSSSVPPHSDDPTTTTTTTTTSTATSDLTSDSNPDPDPDRTLRVSQLDAEELDDGLIVMLRGKLVGALGAFSVSPRGEGFWFGFWVGWLLLWD